MPYSSTSKEGVELQRTYRKNFDRCQLGYQSGAGFVDACRIDTVIVHHIYGRGIGGGLVDTFANYLSACHRCHVWLHSHPVEGRMFAMAAKMDLPRMWDGDHVSMVEMLHYEPQELAIAAGYNVVARIESAIEMHDAGHTRLSEAAVNAGRDVLEATCCLRTGDQCGSTFPTALLRTRWT